MRFVRGPLWGAIILGILLTVAPSGAGAGASDPATPKGQQTVSSIQISAKTMKSDPTANRTVFEGSVIARTDDMSLEADRMVVTYAREDGSIGVIECEGSVKVLQGEKMIVAQHARYDEVGGVIVFTGSPKIFQDKTMVSGSEIRYFPKTDETQVSDGTVIINR